MTGEVDTQDPSSMSGLEGYALSCVTGAGMDSFEKGLSKAVYDLVHGGSEDSVLITRQRHRDHIREAVGHLDVFLGTPDLPMDLAAEELR
jgi:tRNA modification GTPase